MKRLYIYSFTCLIAASFLSACSSGKGGGNLQSSKTGMRYATKGNKDNGGFEVASKFKRGPGPGLVEIEGGVLVVGGSATEIAGQEPNIYGYKRQVTVSSFYMDETEVSNTDWLEYLYWIRGNFPQDNEYYYNELPDTLVWRRPLSYNEPYVDNYLRHPAYADYPVVGVSWEQASRYCEWRTDRVNEFILRQKGIMTDYKTLASGNKKGAADNAASKPSTPFNTDIYLNGQYDDKGKNAPKDFNASNTANSTTGATGKNGITRTVRLEDGILMQPYRLPSEAEWEYAALGLIGNTKYENVSQNKIYPWNGLGISSAKKKTRGMIQANFKRAIGDYMGVGGNLNDKGSITVPVISYLPNDFGLYNMAGNVNEWVFDVYRQSTYADAEALNPVRGNYFVDKRLKDSQKGKLEVDKYGKPIKDDALSGKKLTWAEKQKLAAASGAANPSPTNNQNPVTPNNQSSSLAPGTNQPPIYKADQRGYRDQQNMALYGETTLINDKSRVYKGGSWNDLAYWLNPASRRYLQQDESTADIGFRCAMTMLGASEINSKGKPQFKQKPLKPFKVK